MQDLERIHAANYLILKDIDAVCSRHSVRYFLDYGTLLGAVRHKDFIPWDDDIDIVVLREDYERFIDVCKKELPAKYQVVEYTEHNGYFWDFISRIEIKDSRLHEVSELEQEYGNNINRVCADIFILDKAPANKLYFRLMVLKLKLLYLMAMGHRYRINYSEYPFPKKIIIGLFANIGRLFSLKTIFRWHSAICLSCRSKKKFAYLKNNALVHEMNFMFYEEWYAKTGILPLRDHEFPVPGSYKEVLTTLYGDYMKLPPKEEQKPLHVQDYYISEKFFN